MGNWHHKGNWFGIKISIAVFIMGLTFHVVNGQSYFNKTYDYQQVDASIDYFSFVTHQFDQSEDTFLVVSNELTCGSGCGTLHLSKINKAGDLVEDVGFSDSNYRHSIRNVLEINDSMMILTGYVIPSLGASDIYYGKYSLSGQRIWDTTYSYIETDTFYSTRAFDLIQSANGNLVVCGTAQKDPGASVQPYFSILDQNGSQLLEMTYAGGGTFSSNNTIHSLAEEIGVGFLMVGQKDNELRVLKVDYNGILLWDTIYPSSGTFKRAQKIIQTLDGNFLIGGDETDGFGSAVLLKINGSGEILWETNYGISGSRWITNLVQDDDSTFVAVGMIREDLDNTNGWIARMNRSGELLWERKKSSDISLVPTKDHYLNSVSILGNGQILTSGFGLSSPVNPWVVLLDQCGCDSIHCYYLNQNECTQGVGVKELGYEMEIKAYPNPSNSYFTIKWNLEVGAINGQLAVYNTLGAKVAYYKLKPDQTSIQLIGLEKGMYWVELILEDRKGASLKIVRE